MRIKTRLSDMYTSFDIQNYISHSLSLNELETTSDSHMAERNYNSLSRSFSCNADTQLFTKTKGD